VVAWGRWQVVAAILLERLDEDSKTVKGWENECALGSAALTCMIVTGFENPLVKPDVNWIKDTAQVHTSDQLI
jgi:hypothetical protein